MYLEDKEIVVRNIYSYFQREMPGMVFREKDGIRNLHNVTIKYLDDPNNNLNINFIEELLKRTLIGVNLTKETKKYFSEPEVIEFLLMGGEYPSFEMINKDKNTYKPIPYNYSALEVEDLRRQYEKTKKYLKNIDHSANDLMMVFATKEQLIEKLKENISQIPESTKTKFQSMMEKTIENLKNEIEKEIESLIEKVYYKCLCGKQNY